MLDAFRSAYKDIPYAAFRIVFGVLIAMHGLMKFGIGSNFEYSKLDMILQIAGPMEVVGGVRSTGKRYGRLHQLINSTG